MKRVEETHNPCENNQQLDTRAQCIVPAHRRNPEIQVDMDKTLITEMEAVSTKMIRALIVSELY